MEKYRRGAGQGVLVEGASIVSRASRRNDHRSDELQGNCVEDVPTCCC